MNGTQALAATRRPSFSDSTKNGLSIWLTVR